MYHGNSGYTEFTYKEIRHYSQTITYTKQTYISSTNPDMSLEITKDAITIYLINPKTNQQHEYTYLKLDNYQYKKTWEETISTDSEILYNDIEEETFNYQRTGNEVLLTNSDKKWIGTLDTDAWTLSFVQIVPEKKELPTFKLSTD